MSKPEFKYISFVDGPMAIYRFDIFLKNSPELAKHFIFFCTKFSYNLYKNYHNIFEFEIIDEIQNKYPYSLEKERFINVNSEEEWLAGINNFYGTIADKFYPYEFHRLTLPILADREILNFCIVDNDVLMDPDFKLHEQVFKSIEPGTLYLHAFGVNPAYENRIKFISKVCSKKFTQIDFKKLENFVDGDGNIRGFHFKTKKDMLLFFDIWNTTLLNVIQPDNRELAGTGNRNFYQVEWIVSYIMQFFASQLDYNFTDYHRLFYVNGKNVIIHKTRVEDTIYIGPRPQWEHYKFNYEDTSTVSAFIKNNKSQLERYWKEHVPTVEITDTHVYTKLI
jgi:hypothetical protein